MTRPPSTTSAAPSGIDERLRRHPQLHALVQSALESLNAHAEVGAALAAAPAAVRESLPLVFACSDFVAQSCTRHPALLISLIESGDLERPLRTADFAERAAAITAETPPPTTAGDPEFLASLRRWRRREMVRIAWRDLAGWSSLEDTLAELSKFADAAIRLAYERARQSLVARYGEPRSASGAAQPLIILGMGKLGGSELNFSSDIDLVLLFPEHGETDGARSISNEEFFTRLAQEAVRLLKTPTPDGFVFRVDLRLRPFGDSGAVVSSFASFEDYLQRHGRDWERYAYVKARAITASDAYAEVYANVIRPFVYRRYIDYGVFESLREMKALIEREVERRELEDHVKLGPGGIREIEFIVQAFQLIRGGRFKRLQTTSLLEALPLLDGNKLLPPRVVRELRAAYEYLRRLENRLQMLADMQEHRLPKDDLGRARIALAMGAPDWDAMLATLNAHRECVSRHFESVVFSGGSDADPATVKMDFGRLWESEAEQAALAESLSRAGMADADEAARLLLELRASALVRKLDEPGRKRLQAMLPAVMADIAASRAPLVVLRRVLKIIEAIGQRSVYFALLTESAAARKRLIELAGHGDFLANQIASHPVLLDELLDERLLLHLPARADLEAELDLMLEQVADEDAERQVETLRQFQRVAIFRIAVADLTGFLPLMKVSDRLTEVAEIIVERAIVMGWQQMTAQFGVPMCSESGGARRPVRVCAVGYGKLGGMELGYSSDLDLVFLHDSMGEQQETDAPRAIDNQIFFVRLAQRIVHILTVHTAAGRLYEVDVRLRPSGKGGMLITNIRAFAEYQQKEAWTWEHQALLHARDVAGSPELRAEFAAVRMDVLCNYVRRDTLRAEVAAMRERMRKELSKARAGQFDIKQDAGGIADIEFLAQYWALLWAKDYPPVAMFSDTIRQLESVASAALVPQETVDVLTHAYRAYRTRSHHLSLESREPIVSAADFVAEREAVTRIWNATMTVPAETVSPT
ncbi:MAG TPA: bifunctional [glutamate--ammonia ligase]-adenylyl-L-tyrosine phosphorylase/[glutamate--ammonia-ligase] adenylyltransferase [Steroidobacteraceae bacterium]|nr:bifunctional [glutamate--ammonia ligase]-adenylyl-L-tyrosine phosphorylase/[glutamate--ammonia-ligase] adenylyltransferase [Steroidobacteraceae bacterium]